MEEDSLDIVSLYKSKTLNRVTIGCKIAESFPWFQEISVIDYYTE